MSQQNQPELPVKIYAEAVVRSDRGESLLNSPYHIDSEHVDRFYASGDRLQTVAQRLRRTGFDVLSIGKLSISIAAAPEVYERTFQTNLEAVERPVIKELGQTDTATFINAVDDKPFGEIDVSHTDWNGVLDGIAINEPIYYHFRSELPSVVPPVTANEYLSVPDGVAQGLNATLAHQQGVTGKGVKVVMVDTGWYPHPFFRQHNYNVQVCLAPGSSDPARDDSGHGTGESANLLAISPDVNLTVVKADVSFAGSARNVNSICAFRTAVALQPDIISCSWGSDERRCTLSPYNRVLAAVVANAIHQGIIVVFSAGNGSYGFPAQHPEVIAAGGVFLHLNGSLRGTLEASNYASSFISPIYPERRVPDVCGLVGKLPYASYIMLPVPPGSDVDQRLALVKDGTEPTDSWAAFSGTSAAAPQLAGICALMKQVNPNLSPTQTKHILQQTARDVVEGFTNPSSSGAPARAGPDLATGSGLADAYAAINAAKANSFVRLDSVQPLPIRRQPFQSQDSLPKINEIRRRTIMSSEFPKLRGKLDELVCEFEKILETKIENKEIEAVELRISEDNFIPRSSRTSAVLALVESLMNLNVANKKITDKKTKVEIDEIKKKHVLAAKSLLKVQKQKELATRILIAAIESSDDEVSEGAIEALGEFDSKTTEHSNENNPQNMKIFPITVTAQELDFDVPYTKNIYHCEWSDKKRRIATCTDYPYDQFQQDDQGNWTKLSSHKFGVS